MAKTKYEDDDLIEAEITASLDTDSSGDQVLTLTDLQGIKNVTEVEVKGGGYVGNVNSISSTAVTVRVYQSAGASAEMSAATSTTDAGVTITVRAQGY